MMTALFAPRLEVVTVKQRIEAVVEELRSRPNIQTFDEAATKQVVILRLLDALGWNQYDIDEVRPEYPVTGGKVDYALRLDNSNKVFVEAKRAGEDLGAHHIQLLNYSFSEGVPLAVLTNGLSWWFYLPVQPVPWEERRFCAIDILKQDVPDISSRLMAFLSRENVLSGVAIKDAENVHASLQSDKRIEETLPKAWASLISGPADLLVDLINDTLENLCGIRSGPERIRRFLSEKAKPPAESTRPGITGRGAAPRHIEPTPPAPTRMRRFPNTQRSTAPESIHDYTGKSIVSFTFAGATFNVNRWIDLLTTLAQDIHGRHPTEFDRILEIRGYKRAHFSRDGRDLHQPKRLGNSGYFVEAQISAKAAVQVCHRLLVVFGYDAQDLTIDCS